MLTKITCKGLSIKTGLKLNPLRRLQSPVNTHSKRDYNEKTLFNMPY